jgi:hypothetical protein
MMAMKSIKSNGFFAGIGAFCFYRVPFYLLSVLGFVVCIFRLPDEETLQMLNVSFPVVGILAGISLQKWPCNAQNTSNNA